jgi:ribosomal-protein-alanine N-acetyltransferase
MKNYKIRIATRKDIPYIVRLSRQKWSENNAWSKKSVLERVLKDNPRTCWILEIDGKVSGIRLVCDDFERRAWNWLIMIDTKIQRKGFGTLFSRYTNSQLKKLGYRGVISDCSTDNRASIRWHKKAGYKKLCKMPGWYFDNKDAFLFYYGLK